MALIRCPECGKEISDTSNKCVHCGFFIKKENFKKKLVKNKDRIIGAIVGLGLIVVVISIVINASKCDICDEKAIPNSEYCEAHRCRVEGCKLSKSESDIYCNLHTCDWWKIAIDDECTNIKEEGSEYCYFHKCSEENCLEPRYIFGGSFCESHLIDVVRPLWNKGMSFSKIVEETGIDWFAIIQILDEL